MADGKTNRTKASCGVFFGGGAYNVNIVIFNIFHEVLDRTLSFLKKFQVDL